MKKQPDYRKALRDPYDASTLQNRSNSGRSLSRKDPYTLDPSTSLQSKTDSAKLRSKK
jgi:hypothetical protein